MVEKTELTEEHLRILKQNDTLEKILNQFQNQQLEITHLKKDLGKIQNLLNGEISTTIENLIRDKIETVSQEH